MTLEHMDIFPAKSGFSENDGISPAALARAFQAERFCGVFGRFKLRKALIVQCFTAGKTENTRSAASDAVQAPSPVKHSDGFPDAGLIFVFRYNWRVTAFCA